jgi:hypothetical protein
MFRHILKAKVFQVIPERKYGCDCRLMFCVIAIFRPVFQHDLRAEVLIGAFI